MICEEGLIQNDAKKKETEVTLYLHSIDRLSLLLYAVIENGLSKQLCFRSFPHLSRVASIVEVNNSEVNGNKEVACSSSRDSKSAQRDHRVYAYLAHASTSFLMRHCISEAIIASSTDNEPEESINNTLDARDLVARRASYWSSKGQFKPDVPETLIYKLVSNLCVVYEINIRPFQGISLYTFLFFFFFLFKFDFKLQIPSFHLLHRLLI